MLSRLMWFGQLALIGAVLHSCAWNKSEIEQTKVHEQDLFNTFEVDKTKYSQFHESGTPPAPEVTPAPEEKGKGPSKVKGKKGKAKKPAIVSMPTPPLSPIAGNPEVKVEEFKNYDFKSRPLWDNFHPHFKEGEVTIIDVKFFNVTAGKVTAKVLPSTTIKGKPVYHLYAQIKSAPFYNLVYTLDDYIETFVSKENFMPLKYSLIQRESGQSVDDLQLFDAEKSRTFFWFKRIKNKEEKKSYEEGHMPKYFQDSFSALFFVRGLPLKVGDVYEFPIVTRTKLWLMKLVVEEKGMTDVLGKQIEAYRIKAETHFPGVLEKKGDILFWFAADEERRILKFSAKVKLGTIEGVTSNHYYE